MSAQHATEAGLALCLRIGQRVRLADFKGRRVTGKVQGLSIDSDRVLQADIGLDKPIVIDVDGERPIDIWRQNVAAHEVSPFDERDEQVEALLEALRTLRKACDAVQPFAGTIAAHTVHEALDVRAFIDAVAGADAAIAKVTGSAT